MSNKKFNIVLISPEIPPNTGNIGRLCVNTNSTLHLVKPLGFSLDDRYIRRAGMDYWKHLDLTVHESVGDFLRFSQNKTRYFFSTKVNQTIYQCPYEDDSFLIFGNEGSGLPPEFYERFKDNTYTIPMPGNNARSLNLANSVAIVLFEGLRPD
jgi:tRNA (cytidine/uridine-2'-O-)-methyltransferase